MERNDFSNFARKSPEAHFCEIILKSVHWSMRRCHLKVFLFLPLAAERNDFCNFGRGSPKEQLYEIILKLVDSSRRRCHLNVFYILSSGGHFVQ